jgi:hypothetical protein
LGKKSPAAAARPVAPAWKQVAQRQLPAGGTADFDLSAQVPRPGQYEIRLEGPAVAAVRPLFDGQPGEERFLEKIGPDTYRLNRTQAVAEGSRTGVRVTLAAGQSGKVKVLLRPK